MQAAFLRKIRLVRLHEQNDVIAEKTNKHIPQTSFLALLASLRFCKSPQMTANANIVCDLSRDFFVLDFRIITLISRLHGDHTGLNGTFSNQTETH